MKIRLELTPDERDVVYSALGEYNNRLQTRLSELESDELLDVSAKRWRDSVMGELITLDPVLSKIADSFRRI